MKSPEDLALHSPLGFRKTHRYHIIYSGEFGQIPGLFQAPRFWNTNYRSIPWESLFLHEAEEESERVICHAKRN